jgi:hypothetical protein
MAEFYITKVPPDDELLQCREAMANQWPVTVTGQVAGGTVVREFRGLVRAIDDLGDDAPANRRWRVTMLEQA